MTEKKLTEKQKKTLMKVGVVFLILLIIIGSTVAIYTIAKNNSEPDPTDPPIVTVPDDTEPTKPDDPTDPPTVPTEPDETDPTIPEDTEPTDPDPTDPTEPEDTEPEKPTPHTHKKKVTDVAANCTTDGYHRVVCTECGKVLEHTVVPAHGHPSFKVTKRVEPEVGVDGYIEYTCIKGDYSYRETIPALSVGLIGKPKASPLSFVYNGKAQGPSIVGTVSSQIEYSADSVRSATEVGTYSITIKLKDPKTTAWADGTTEDIVFTWQITPKTVDLSWGVLTWDYDGKEHSTTCVVSNLCGKDSCDVVLEGNSITLPGTKTVKAVKLTNKNYKLPNDVERTLKINMGSIGDINSKDAEYIYDGEKHTIEAPACNTKGVSFVYSTEKDGEYTSKLPEYVDAGKYTIYWKAIHDVFPEVKGSNKLTIKHAAAKMPTATNVVYNGEVQRGVFDAEGVVLSGQCEAKYCSTYTAHATPDKNHCWEDGSFSTKTILWTIEKKTIGLKWGQLTWTYDGNEHSTTCEATGLIGEDTCSVTLEGNSITNVGSKEVKAVEVSDPNYKLPAEGCTKTMTITPAFFSVGYGDTTVVYDGNSHTISAPEFSVDGVKIAYGLDKNGPFGDEMPEFVNAGTYTVYWMASKDNYYTMYGNQEITILQKHVEIKWGELSWIYDGEEHSTTCEVKSQYLCGSDVCTVELEGNSIIEVGTKPVKAVGLSNENYTFSSTAKLNETLTITDGRLGNIQSADAEYIYDGRPHSIPDVSCGTPGAIITYAESEDGVYTTKPYFEDAGVYTIYWKVEKAGYQTVYGHNTLTIHRAPDAYVNTYDFPYQGYELCGINFSYGTVTVTGDIYAKDAGTYTVYGTPTANYAWSDGGTDTRAFEWHISPAEILLSWGETEWMYDGLEHSTTCLVDPLYGEDVCEVILEGNSITEVGEKTVKAVGLSNSNYAIAPYAVKEAVLRIYDNPWANAGVASAQLGWLDEDGNSVFGFKVAPQLFRERPDIILKSIPTGGGHYTYPYTYNHLGYGSSYCCLASEIMLVHRDAMVDEGTDFDPNMNSHDGAYMIGLNWDRYEIISEDARTATIKFFTARADSTFIEFLSLEPFECGHSDMPPLSEQGLAIEDIDGYKTLTWTVVFPKKVDIAEVEIPTINPVEFEYNGQEQGPIESTDIANSEYIKYGDGTVLKATDAGEFKITYVLKNKDTMQWSDGTTGDITYEWKITQKTVDLVWGETEWEYDGEEHSTTCDVQGLVDGDECTVVLENNKVGPEPDTETVVAKELTNDNYKLPEDNTKEIKIVDTSRFLVNKPSVSPLEFVYNGEYQGPAISIPSEYASYINFGDNCVYNAVNVGTYSITFQLVDPETTTWADGTTADVVVEWKITPKEIGLQWGQLSWNYDGEAHSTTCVATGLVGNDECEITLTDNSVGPEVGSETVEAASLSNANYALPSNKTATLEIKEVDTTEYSYTLTYGEEFNSFIPSGAQYIIFTDMDIPENVETTDVSDIKDNSVRAWYDSNTTTYYVAAINNHVTYANKDCSSMFKDRTKLRMIVFHNIDTTKTEDMSYMFYGVNTNYNTSLFHLNLANFDTTNVKNTDYMFYGCYDLATIYVSDLWDMSNVTSSNHMFPIQKYAWQDGVLFGQSGNSYINDREGYSFNNDKRLANYKDGLLTYYNWEEDTLAAGPVIDQLLYPTVNETVAVYIGDYSDMIPSNATDISVEQDGSIVGWMSNHVYYITHVDGKTINASKSLCNMFASNSAIEVIKFENFDTSFAENMSGMFMDTYALHTVNLEALDTSNTINMSNMLNGLGFNYSDGIVIGDGASSEGEIPGGVVIDISTWDTSKVENFSHTFARMCGTFELDVTTLDTSSAKDMCGMFNDCVNLTELDLSHFNMSNVETISSMFAMSSQLATINTDGWDTSNITDMSSVFWSCSNLSEVTTLEDWDVSNVTNMDTMFIQSFDLTKNISLDLSRWDVSNVKYTNKMFYNTNLADINIEGWTPHLIEAAEMFSGCKKFTKLDVSGFNVDDVTTMKGMFNWCAGLTELDVENWDPSKCDNFDNMFANCTGLTRLDLTNWGHIKSSAYMMNTFGGCSNLYEIYACYNWDTGKMSEQSASFAVYDNGTNTLATGRYLRTLIPDNIQHIYFGDYHENIPTDTSVLIDMTANRDGSVVGWIEDNTMYITTLDGSTIKTCGSFGYVFRNLRDLLTVSFENFDTSAAHNLEMLFYVCQSLEEIDISCFNTSKVTDVYRLFNNCYKVKTIYVGDGWDMSNVTNSTNMFCNNNKLVGQSGRQYSSSNADDVSMANYETGYLTKKTN